MIEKERPKLPKATVEKRERGAYPKYTGSGTGLRKEGGSASAIKYAREAGKKKKTGQ